MKKILYVIAASAAVLAAASCSTIDKMTKMAEQVTVTCEPSVLEVVAGEIDATVSVTYPAGYFNPKAIVKVTPVIVYEGGEASMKEFVYQGEKVKDNYKLVSSDGQTVTEKVHFDYVKGMEKCYLELRSTVLFGKKDIPLPVKKVADGANTTYMLVKDKGVVSLLPDGYVDTYTVTKEGQILYQVNSADVRSSELSSASIKELQKVLEEAKENDRAVVKGTEIVAYASPEGAEALNNKLSENRSKSASKAWDKVAKGTDATPPEVKSAGEDWEGFQALVAESDIQDKDLILRVLSMYSDPAVRESEIRNLSEIFTELKAEVLPELRRARLIATVEYSNPTSEELLKLLDEDEDVLSEAALLRAATLVSSDAAKQAVYNKAIKKFDSDKARYNLAVLLLNEGDDKAAEKHLNACKLSGPEISNAKGVVALRHGDLETAANFFRAAANDDAEANMGIVAILQGNYDEAVALLEDSKGCCHNPALAYILTDQLEKASAKIHCECPKCIYLKAIIAARQGRAADVKKFVEAAGEDSPELKARALNDIEFAGYDL